MGVVHAKRRYKLVSTVDSSSSFSSINIVNYQQNNGMPLEPSFQQTHWNRVFTPDQRGRRSSSGNAKQVPKTAR